MHYYALPLTLLFSIIVYGLDSNPASCEHRRTNLAAGEGSA
jgi:hypothetical protein